MKNLFLKSVLHKLMGAFNVVVVFFFGFGSFHEFGFLGFLLVFGIAGSVVLYITLNTKFFKGDDWIGVLTIFNCIAMVVLAIGSQL